MTEQTKYYIIKIQIEITNKKRNEKLYTVI